MHQDNDFEKLLTRNMWTNPQFKEQVQKDPRSALKSIGVDLPEEMKIKIIPQRPDTLYFTIPEANDDPSQPTALETINQIDLWSSSKMFVWLVPIDVKLELLRLRKSIYYKGEKNER